MMPTGINLRVKIFQANKTETEQILLYEEFQQPVGIVCVKR